MAELFHGSPYHLHRTFKRIKGVTVSDYVQQIRISEAMNLLSSNAKTVREIANLAGIPNASYFATLFHQKTGLTPTEYRQRKSTRGRNQHEPTS
ncbi:helix-turn-helix transcriptional regulator [Salibacterium aidingense]|uniref:helix-turn-helix transcriptional regulator n=1 Tax=Salibacterium aidingense TaxID=384933 RepID=UPI003BE6CE95